MTRQDKINLIKGFASGEAVISNLPKERDTMTFERTESGSYICRENNITYSQQEIDELDHPYRALKQNGIHPNWEEVKQYEDKRIVQIGMPFHVRINIAAQGDEEPSVIILQAITREMLNG